jgi:hypothetical protein
MHDIGTKLKLNTNNLIDLAAINKKSPGKIVYDVIDMA